MSTAVARTPASTPATRALADAIAGQMRDTLDADNPVQGKVKSAPNWTTMTVPIEIDGATSSQPFSNDFTPEVGSLVWLRGPAGAKLVTDRVGGKAATKVINAAQQTVRGGSTIEGAQLIQNGLSVNDGGLYVGGAKQTRLSGNAWFEKRLDVDDIARARRLEAEEHVLSDTMGCNTLGVGTVNAGRLNGYHVGRSDGDHVGTNYGDQRGNMFGTCNGTHYGDQRGNSFGKNFGDLEGNDVGCNHIGCGVGNFGDLSYVRLVPPPSERGLKDEDSPIDGAYALRFVAALDFIRYRLKEHLTVGGMAGTSSTPAGPPPLQAGIYVDTVAEWAPELVLQHANADGATGHRTYDRDGLHAYYGAAIAHLAADRDETRAERDELRAQLADLVVRVETLEERTAA